MNLTRVRFIEGPFDGHETSALETPLVLWLRRCPRCGDIEPFVIAADYWPLARREGFEPYLRDGQADDDALRYRYADTDEVWGARDARETVTA